MRRCGTLWFVAVIGLGACGPGVEAEDAGGDSAGSSETGDARPEGIDCSSLSDDDPVLGPGDDGPLRFPVSLCNPRSDDADGPYVCCSDDPAASSGLLPAYEGRGTDGGMPLFSGASNESSLWGVCARIADISDGLREDAAVGCPVPCNPTWSGDDVDAVCGAGSVCCQTREVHEWDCILDGDTWRPATGDDVFAGLSDWASARHATHQDANGFACIELADVETPEFEDCVRQLSVADQRGLCMPAGSCPVDPGYTDACEMLNAG